MGKVGFLFFRGIKVAVVLRFRMLFGRLIRDKSICIIFIGRDVYMFFFVFNRVGFLIVTLFGCGFVSFKVVF